MVQLTDLQTSREEVFSLYNKKQSDIDSDLLILKEWIKKQPHLPINSLQDELLEIYLLKNQFSIEKTKIKLEKYCTMKASDRYKYLYQDYLHVPSQQPQYYVPMPKLTDDFHRIIIGKVWDEENYDMKRELINSLASRELLSRYDYNDGEIVVLDFSECSSKYLSKLKMTVLADGAHLMYEAHAARIKQIHFISKFASIAIKLGKPFLPSKQGSRIVAHADAESLKNHLPMKCLPKDYGGELKSLNEMRADLDEIFIKHREELDIYVNTKATEETKQGESSKDKMDGTFKKLVID